MAEWWEDDEKIHEESLFGIWWKGTKKNAHRACPDILANAVGLGLGSFTVIPAAGETLGYNTPISIIRGAGTRPEVRLAATAIGTVWCGSSYFGGAVDAFYQLHHNGEHLLGMHAVDWYISQEKGVENFLVKLHEWWKT